MSVLPTGIAAPTGGYEISRSVRLRSSASAYLQRTNGTTGTNPLKFTVSGWMKRGLSSAAYFPLLGSNTGLSAFDFIGFAGDNLVFRIRNSSAVDIVRLESSAVYRDFSAWYHIVAAYDSANATSTNRVKLYVNGVQLTSFGTATYPSLNQAPTGDFLTDMQIGRTNINNVTQTYGDGYLTEINFIDGQALTPSDFGETDTTTGVWKPKRYAGTYGTNGFYLNFSDNSAATAAAIGKDNSGNGNNWTPNNISVTSGVTYDSMLDVPTMYADGGNGRGNYCTLNPLAANSAVTAAQGNLSYTSSNDRIIKSTISVTSGKWYWEFAPGGGGSTSGCGAINPSVNIYATVNLNIATAGVSYLGNGNKSVNGTASSYGATYTSGNTIGVALDLDTNAITFYKDNTSQGSISITSGLEWCPAFDQNTGTNYVNFGQRPFAYTPPTGFTALNTQNLPDATIKKGNAYFDATTFTGNASTQSIVNSGGMQPDLVWLKSRSNANNHTIYDVIRGVDNILYPNLTNAAVAGSGNLTAFNSNGFTLGASENSNDNSGESSVGWQWKAGGSAVSNTNGSITSSVSAGASQGFSVVTYTGTGSAATVGHGLGVAPSMVIIKDRDSGSNFWVVGTKSLGFTSDNYLRLNATSAVEAGGGVAWNNTAPTSTTVSIGNSTVLNASGNDYVMYAFAEVAGYSKFGSYTANGSSDGVFVHLGFKPKFVMVKGYTGTSSDTTRWLMLDSSRDTYNATKYWLYANLSNAEASLPYVDFLSNGFKLRDNNLHINQSGISYIYMAFAENPFKNSLAR